MKDAVLASFLTLLAAVGGCPSEPKSPLGLIPLSDRRPADPNGDGSDGRLRMILLVQLHMSTIEAPVGMVSSSEEIWSYLDEERVKSVRSAGLSRNGLRVGLGKHDSWTDVARILQRLTGRTVVSFKTAAAPHVPVPIRFGGNRPGETIYTSYDDRTFSLRTYPPGNNVLNITCTLDPDDPSTIVITGVPQIHTVRRKTKVIMTAGGKMPVERPIVLSFHALTFQLSMASKDFLVIGPSAAARDTLSLGHRFLVKNKKGLEFETLLVIMPEVAYLPPHPGKGADQEAGRAEGNQGR